MPSRPHARDQAGERGTHSGCVQHGVRGPAARNSATVTFNYKIMGLLTGKWVASQLSGGQGTVGIVDTNRSDSSVQQIDAGGAAASQLLARTRGSSSLRRR